LVSIPLETGGYKRCHKEMKAIGKGKKMTEEDMVELHVKITSKGLAEFKRSYNRNMEL